MLKTYKLCLIGFGNIGRALARLLQEKISELRERYGIEWSITGVATRRLGWVADPIGLDVSTLLAGEFPPEHASLSLSNVREWLAVAQADVLFEDKHASRGLFACSIQSVKLLLAYLDRRSSNVLFEMLHLGSSGDRQHRA